MKIIALFTIFGACLPILNVRASDSAYANASLDLTSSNQVETATATSTVGVGYANAMAQPGSMDNAIETIASAGGSSTTYQNESFSAFTDKLVITDPALTGDPGTLDFNFEVNGTENFSATSPGYSSITASADFTAVSTSTVTDDFSFTKDSTGTVTAGSDFLGDPETVVVPFTFGTPFTISLKVDITGLVEGLTGSGAAMVSGSFTTTAGTSDVTSSVQDSLLPSAGYSEKAASGQNYASQVTPLTVPEPDCPVLAIAGITAVSVLALRRRPARP
jgi:hypothetical protein